MSDELDDDQGFDVCESCGADLSEEAASSFGLPSGGWLCLACGIERGGEFDASDEVWTAAPRIADLARAET